MKDDKMARLIRLSGLQSRCLSQDNIAWVRKVYGQEWNERILELYCRRKWHHRLVITNHSVRVAQKMLNQLNIEVFPIAERLTTPTKDAGEWSWCMQTLTRMVYGSSEPLRVCARHDNTLYVGGYEEIGTEPSDT